LCISRLGDRIEFQLGQCMRHERSRHEMLPLP
jgi:hypothetical protein